MYKAVVVGSDHINCLSVIRGLGEKRISFFVFLVCDKKPELCIKSKYIKNNYKVTNLLNLEEELIGFGMQLEEKIPIFPCGDSEAYIIDNKLDTFCNYYLCPNIDFGQGRICEMMDKYEQNLLAKKIEIPMAQTSIFQINDLDSLQEYIDYPAVIKPRISAFGNKSDIQKVSNENELQQVIRQYKSKGYKEVLIQEYIEMDYECTFFGYIGRNIPIECTGVKKIYKWPPNGPSAVFSHTIDVPEEVSRLLKYIQKIGYEGMFDLEVFVVGKLIYLNEINFRHTGLGYIDLSCENNAPYDMYRYYMGMGTFSRKRVKKAIYAINSLGMFAMLKAKKISMKEFVVAEIKSKSHSTFEMSDLSGSLRIIIMMICNHFAKK